MKRGMMVVALCVGAWLCGTAYGQETVVTNLIVTGTVSQGTNAIAAGTQSAAFGEGAMADGDFSHAEGDTTTAGGTASHAEGALTIAGGDQSHAEGLATEALAGNSHAGGTYARVRVQDSNSFIHATGTATNDMKETQFHDTAHFDHLVTLELALDASNAVLSRAENDQRYLVTTNGYMNADLHMNESNIRDVSVIGGFDSLISFEERLTSRTDVWHNWNADMLDGYHADSFATTQQVAQKLSVTGGFAGSSYNLYYGDDVEGARARYYVNDGSILWIGGEEPTALDSMHIKMAWDVSEDDPANPSIDLKPYAGASLKGLGGTSDRWWTDGRFTATNAGKTSEFFAVNSERFIGDGSGLVNLPVTGLTTNEADERYVQHAGDTMTGNLVLAGTLRLSNTLETVCAPGFQSDGIVTIHWMTPAGTYFKYGSTGGNGDRIHFGSDGSLDTWGSIYSQGDISADGDIYAGSYNGAMGAFPDIPWASFATTQQVAQKMSVTGGLADTMFKVTTYGGLGPEDDQKAQLAVGGNGTIDLIGGEETVAQDGMHIKMRWDIAGDDPSDPSIDLKPHAGASLKGLGGFSDRWWTDGRFFATNAGKTSEYFAVKAVDSVTASIVKNVNPLSIYSGDGSQSGGFWISSNQVEVQGDLWIDGGGGSSFLHHYDTGDLDLGYNLSVGGNATIGTSTNETNLTVVGWAKIDYVSPQGGISMGIYTNR